MQHEKSRIAWHFCPNVIAIGPGDVLGSARMSGVLWPTEAMVFHKLAARAPNWV